MIDGMTSKVSWAGVAILGVGAVLTVSGVALKDESLTSTGAEVLAGGGLILGIGQFKKGKEEKK